LKFAPADWGIDRRDSLIGIPSILISTGGGSGVDNIPFATPEDCAFVEDASGSAVFASVRVFVAYWNDTGEVIASSGAISWGRTLREDFWFLGTGPAHGWAIFRPQRSDCDG